MKAENGKTDPEKGRQGERENVKCKAEIRR
jgi:hypothetical protein